MRVFVTGATGFIGSAVVPELISAGHQVIGLARSERGAAQLRAQGAMPHRGRLEDIESLVRGAEQADAVIHLAFIHAFTDASLSTRIASIAKGVLRGGVVGSFLGSIMRTDRDAIHALGSVMERRGGALAITVGTLGLPHGRVVSEADDADPAGVGAPRSVPAEGAARHFAERGVRTAVVRLPPTVHGEGDAGFIPQLAEIARKKGASAYIGDGTNRWGAVHRLDAARLYRLALERADAGERFHGVAEEGIPFREIANLIGRRLQVPVVAKRPDEAPAHFGFLAPFVGADNPALSARTQSRLDWLPSGPTLLDDIDRDAYFAPRVS
ncbi:MAG: SDR family oxidoreductase [bacterium]|nr:SDR family oxidoreductase [bacterium]